jgi:hypothetical protein
LPTESIDQFVTRLRQKADYCQFETKKDENIRDQVIEKCLSNRLRIKLLEKGADLTLERLQTIARAIEASTMQAESIASSNTTHGVNRVQYKRDQSTQQRYQGSNRERRCYRRTLSSDEKCPARGGKCAKCNGIGHFAKLSVVEVKGSEH